MPLDNPTSLPTPYERDPFADFNTSASPILFPVGERLVGWQTKHGTYQECPSHKAIIRLNAQGNGAQLLNIVGIDYKLVHNKDLYTRVETTMKEQMLPEHLHDVQVTDKVSGFGKVCYRQYIFPSIKCKVGSNMPAVAFRIIVQNGYGSSALRIYTGAIDFYCSNGMIRGEYTSAYKKHTKGLVIDNLTNMVQDSLLQFAHNGDVWSRWARTRFSAAKGETFLTSVGVTNRLRDKLMVQYQREADTRGENLWAFYSAITYYASHADGEFKMHITTETNNREAETMLNRERSVAKWTQTQQWKALELT